MDRLKPTAMQRYCYHSSNNSSSNNNRPHNRRCRRTTWPAASSWPSTSAPPWPTDRPTRRPACNPSVGCASNPVTGPTMARAFGEKELPCFFSFIRVSFAFANGGTQLPTSPTNGACKSHYWTHTEKNLMPLYVTGNGSAKNDEPIQRTLGHWYTTRATVMQPKWGYLFWLIKGHISWNIELNIYS